MITVQDSITAPNNATLDRPYQVFQADGITGQDITNWSFHSQWRYADGTLGLDLTLANGLIVITDAPSGKYKILVTPYDLQTLVVGPLAFDILATPPPSSGTVSETYVEVSGVVTISEGATQADFIFTVGAPCSTTGGSTWTAPPSGGGLTSGGLGTSLLDAAEIAAALADAAASAQAAMTASAQALVAAQAATQAQSSAATAAAAAVAASNGSGTSQPLISSIDSGEQDDAGSGSADTGSTSGGTSSGASSGETYTAIDSGTG